MKRINDILAMFPVKEEDFVCVEITVYRDRMNNGWYEEAKEPVIIPKIFQHQVDYAMVDFTMTGIRFYDKEGNELFATVGEGYCDTETPKAFFVEHFDSSNQEIEVEKG